MIAYKKVRKLKDGKDYPLFIDKTKPFRFGEWMKSEFHPTKGFAERSIGKGSDGEEIGGWHLTPLPKADWIADQLSNGEKRVWIVCEAKNIVEYQRPQGIWYLAQYIKPLRVLRQEEVERYESHDMAIAYE